MGMTIQDLGRARPNVVGGPGGNGAVPSASVTSAVSSPLNRASSSVSNMGDAGVGPAMSWIAIGLVLVGIHVLWRLGGRPGGNIVPLS